MSRESWSPDAGLPEGQMEGQTRSEGQEGEEAAHVSPQAETRETTHTSIREQVERHFKSKLGLETVDVVTEDSGWEKVLKDRLGVLFQELDDPELSQDFELSFEPNRAGVPTLVLSREGKSLAVLGLQPDGRIRGADTKYIESFTKRVDIALSMLEAVRFGQGKQKEERTEYYLS